MASSVQFCLFGLLLLPLANCEGEVCHHPMKVQINQKRLAMRPSDNVTLECHFSGISNEKVTMYTWTRNTWTLDNLVTIYRYNTTNHTAWWRQEFDGKVNETHVFLSDGILTNLEITVNSGDEFSYQCDFYTDIKKMCADEKQIAFQDPDVSDSLTTVGNSDDHVTSPSPTTVPNFDDHVTSPSPTTVPNFDDHVTSPSPTTVPNFDDHVTSPSPTTVPNFDDPDVLPSPTTVVNCDVECPPSAYSCYGYITYAFIVLFTVIVIILTPIISYKWLTN